MKARCGMCFKYVETEASIKTTRGYKYIHCFDSDPCTFEAKPEQEKGFLCFNCQEKIKECMREQRMTIGMKTLKEALKENAGIQSIDS